MSVWSALLCLGGKYKVMLEVKNITHSYATKQRRESVPVFEDFSAAFQDGEVVAIVGPSGCGKTTLVNILAGYIVPNHGEVLVDGGVANQPGRDRLVINQDDDLFGWMTVHANMALVSRDEERISHLLRVMGLAGCDKLYPHELSGGMKKRLSLARALLTDARLIIMDEPFGSLDYQTKERLHMEVLDVVKSTKRTVIIVTHDIDEAVFLSDKVIVLTGSPASAREIFPVQLTSPRELALKDTQEFIKLKQNIKSSLRLPEVNYG